MTPNPLKEGLFKEWFGARNGYFDVPQKPGLGVELKDGLAELYPPVPEGNWYRPDPDMPPPPSTSAARGGPAGTDVWPSRPGGR